MGVRVAVSKPELYPQGNYHVQVTGNEINTKTGKVKVKFVIASGPYTGRPLSRNFNPVVSPQSHLGELLIACGVQIEQAQAGSQLDLDIINGAPVLANLTHYQTQNGVINSLGDFRRMTGGTVAQAAPVMAQPIAVAPPAVAVAPQPVQAAPQAAPQFTPAAPVTAAPPAPAAPVLGPKISF